MKKDRILDSIACVDAGLIEKAENVSAEKRNHGWIRWGAAACLCLVLAAVWFWHSEMTDASVSLSKKLAEMEISCETVKDPRFIADHETPRMTKEDLLTCIRSNTAVQGTVSSMENVRISDEDAVWYITTFDITVDRVLKGDNKDSTIHVVSAAQYRGHDADSRTVPNVRLIGCAEGMHGVFVLRELEDTPWLIRGRKIFPKTLGDHYVVCCLKGDGDVFTDVEQNVSVTIDEIEN